MSKTNDKRRKCERRAVIANDEIVLAAKAVPCFDCKRMFPAVCMDFDHVSGVKKAGISSLVRNASEKRLREEMAKCQVVCANCHRLRTHPHRAKL